MIKTVNDKFIETYNMMTDGFESVETIYKLILKNKLSEKDEAIASILLNRAISKFTSAEAMYIIFSKDLKESNLHNVFNLFYIFESEFIKELIDNTSYGATIEAYENLKNVIEQY